MSGTRIASPGTGAPPPTRTDRLLGGIERVGNALPEPFILFAILFLVVGLISTALAAADVQVTVPGANRPTVVRGLFSGEGLGWLFTTFVSNFIGFPPLGTVLTILLAVGLAERSGLLTAVIRLLFGGAPRWALPYAVGLVGVSANVMADSAFIVVPPLAALVFAAAGRHPVAGLLGGFAATGAGYSTSIFVTSIDALFAGITTAVTRTLPNPGAPVSPVSNYYFNAVAAVILGLVAGLVIARVVEPRLERQGVPRERADAPQAQPVGSVSASAAGDTRSPEAGEATSTDATSAAGEQGELSAELGARERRALRWAGLATGVLALALVVTALLPGSFFRNDSGGFLPRSPLLDSTVSIVFVLFLVPALVYGALVGTIRSSADVPRLITGAVQDLAAFVVLAFILGQFIALFTWTGIGSWLAVTGADTLQSLGFTGFGAILGFVVLASLLNLFIISGSSLWTLLASVFVPLFLLLGYEPAFVQAAFRVGDSATQVMTPLNPYMIVLLAFVRRYEPEAGLGTVMARMVPFVVPFFLAWTALLALFYFAGFPFGPGTNARLTP
ncbi:MAG: AbgT family transporter [Actinomycetota bacterium]|nr:AbgT family transporter [Actinomycetota bacterium]